MHTWQYGHLHSEQHEHFDYRLVNKVGQEDACTSKHR